MKKSLFSLLLPAVGISLLAGCNSGRENPFPLTGNSRNLPVCEKPAAIPLQKAKCFAEEKYFVIFTPENPSKVQVESAKELHSYLKRLYTAPMLYNGSKAAKVSFYIGRTKGDEKLFAHSPMKEFGIFPAMDHSAAILIDGAKIAAIYPAGDPLPEADQVIDAAGAMTMPGFVDVHCHGRSGVDFCDATDEAMTTFAVDKLKEGVTTLLPSTLTLPEDQLAAALQTARNYVEAGSAGCKVPAVLRRQKAAAIWFV